MISIAILVGGKGKRVKSITNGKSKAEIKLNKTKNIIDYQLTELTKLNKNIYIISNKNFVSLKQYVKKKYRNNKISFIDEDLQLGTAGAIKNLENIKYNQDFLIVFGDLLFNFDFQKLIDFHKFKKSECTLVVHPNSHPIDSDCVELNDNSQVVEFYKKPHNKKKIINNLCLSGILIINKKFLKLIKPHLSQDISKNLLDKILNKNNRIFGYKTREYIKDVGTLDRVEQAKKDFLKSIELDKSFIDPYKNLFKLNLKTQDYDSAIKNGKKVIELEIKKNPISYFNLALAYDLNKDYKKAIDLYKIVEKLNFKEKKILFNNLAKCFLANKNIDEAKNYYLKALELNQNDKIIVNNLLILFLRIGDKNRAEFFYKKA